MNSSLTLTQELMQKISGTHWLDNKYVSGSGPRTAVIDPATAIQCGEFAHDTNTEIDSAVRNANRAQREWW
jgi:acyl-CoA reductase-like NAD-dependent aldehyde dehydrogenase